MDIPVRCPPGAKLFLAMKTLRLLSVVCFGAFLLFTGCGKKNDSAASTSTDQSSAASAASSSTATAAPASGRPVEITANDQMKYSVNEIRAKPGEAISVTLKNIGTVPKFSMGHNFVLFKKADAIEAFVADVPTAAATDYVPASHKDDLIAHTKLLGPKEQDTVTFNAPTTPGRYPFLCSFPGHYQVGMKGELIVE